MADTEALLAAWSERSDGEAAAWARARPGPSLESVATRISRIPQEFLDERISLRALAGDILGGQISASTFDEDPRVRRGAAIGLWLVASEDVLEPLEPALASGWVALAVDALALRVAPVASPSDWTSDDERRTEAARTFLLWCGFLPAGEDAATAASLLAACDSLARNRALAEAFEGHRHRAEIARKLAEARRKEAAARYSSE